MKSILGQLRPDDIFDVLLFDNEILELNGHLTTATEANIRAAQLWVLENLHASGGTGIHDALVKSVARLLPVPSENYVKMSIFLSDGQPTYGIRSLPQIRNAARFQDHSACLHSLGLGFNLDFEFLQALSWDNCGVARRIYAEGDAAEQLQDFFKELSQPLLRDLSWQWPSGVQTDRVAHAQLNAEVYFGGGEICTVGKYEASTESPVSDASTLGALLTTGLRVSAVASLLARRLSLRGLSTARTGNLSLRPSSVSIALDDAANVDSNATAPLPNGFTERLWAHLRIKELLQRTTATDNLTAVNGFRAEALALALRYSLVTPLTSLVVVEPDEALDSPDATSDAGASRRRAVPSPGAGGGGAVAASDMRNEENSAQTSSVIILLVAAAVHFCT
jgi:inter-alpha-trypsin inhibitor heavy chain H2